MSGNIVEVPWVAEARKYIGVAEIAGDQHHPLILSWWKKIKRGGIKDDETPWCSAAAGACLEACGIRSSRFEGASSYLGWGEEAGSLCYGCVVVLRTKVGYHVGFAVGKTADNRVVLLGGNQGNRFKCSAFPVKYVEARRWPIGVTGKGQFLPLLHSDGSVDATR